jgi:ankyrin repeat protein
MHMHVHLFPLQVPSAQTLLYLRDTGDCGLHVMLREGQTRNLDIPPPAYGELLALLSQEALNHKDGQGNTILHILCRSKRWKTAWIRQVVELGADVNTQDGLGRTPLHVIMETGARASVRPSSIMLCAA